MEVVVVVEKTVSHVYVLRKYVYLYMGQERTLCLLPGLDTVYLPPKAAVQVNRGCCCCLRRGQTHIIRRAKPSQENDGQQVYWLTWLTLCFSVVNFLCLLFFSGCLFPAMNDTHKCPLFWVKSNQQHWAASKFIQWRRWANRTRRTQSCFCWLAYTILS